MYKIDLLRQIEANTRGGALSDCYSKYDLWRMIERNTRVPFVPTKQWRVNYTGQGYVEIPEMDGLDNYTYSADIIFDRDGETLTGQHENGKRIYFGRSGVGTAQFGFGSIYKATPLKIDKGIQYNFKLSIAGTACKFLVDDVIVDSAISSYSIDRLFAFRIGGVSLGSIYALDGSITNIRLTNQDGSDNRFYESIIKSATQPDTLELVDSISGKNGTLINFPQGQEWTDTYNLANGLWDMSQRELVPFTRSTKAWLDGVEYAPNEPRYKGGELLVEGQSTNLSVNDYVRPALATITEFDSFKTVHCNRENATIVVGVNLSVTSTPLNNKTTFSFDIRASSSAFVGATVTRASWSQVIGNQWYAPITLTADWVRVSATSLCEALFVGYYSNSDGNKELDVSFDIKNIQMEIGTVSTSYIPTTTTAVTRAADIATVRDKS